MKKSATKPKAVPKPAMLQPDPKYVIEDAMRTMVRAHEIRADPKLHDAVKAHAAHMAANMKKVARGAKP